MKKKGLGKGIGALLGDWQEAKQLTVSLLDVNLLRPNPNQPRKQFNPSSLQELAESIKSEGLLQPILVRPKENGYEIIAGERRFRAAQMAGLKKIPAIIKELSDRETLLIALMENIHREDLSPIEQAQALLILKQEFELSQEELAAKVKLSRSQVANLLRLLSLPDNVQQLIEEGKISAGHGRILAGIKEPHTLQRFLEKILNHNLSVRELEQAVKRFKVQPKKTIPSIDQRIKVLEQQLQQKLSLKTKFKGTQEKGKVIIHYSSPQELDKLLQLFT